ncbi:MAG: dethiobiotin synthase, partial [Bdellovibrionaceae bacterium]|nr:dethiobiotin synthase [Pseudobdellovibrionaceae bacterium]
MLNSQRCPQGIFVTGTDTGIGKTFVATLLCQLLKEDFSLKYFKPIQTGCESDNDTATVIKNAQLLEKQRIPCVYSLELPASPDRAAAAEEITIDEQKILNVFQKNKEHFLIVEGAGGVEVPIRENYRMTDLMRSLQLPVLVVASTRLGTINHTLLTVKSLKLAGLKILGVVLNGPEDVGLKETLERENVEVLAEVPFVIDDSLDYRKLSKHLEPVRSLINSFFVEDTSGAADAQCVWHPFTQHKTEKNFPMIASGAGATLYTESGHALLDATSSWWVNLHGHSHREIADAISTQAAELEHVIFAGYTHKPAVQLSQTLLQEAQQVNPDWSKVFFSDNGSTAVEVALKMAYQYHELRGEKREKF